MDDLLTAEAAKIASVSRLDVNSCTATASASRRCLSESVVGKSIARKGDILLCCLSQITKTEFRNMTYGEICLLSHWIIFVTVG